MAPINRFFNPSQGRYQSQFVPKQLPVDLMAKSLYGKQAQADQMMAASIKLGEWDQPALGWHDQEYVKGIKNEIQDFVAEGMAEDRTSPEFQRRYLELTQRIKNDPNLKKVSNSVAVHAAYQENIAKHKAAGNDAYAEALEADYLYRLNEYTKEGGKGFAGLSLGDENIKKGTNVFKDALEFFTPLKESGGDSIAYLDSGIAYKNGWTGISDKRVKDQAERQYNLWENTDAGKQLRLEALGKAGYVETTYNELPTAEKEKIDKTIDSYMRNEFLEVGRSVVHGKSTTSKDEALRAGRTEALAEEAAVLTSTEGVQTEESIGATRSKQMEDLKENISDLKKALEKHKNSPSGTLTNKQAKEYEEQLAVRQAQYNTIKKEHDSAWQVTKKQVYANLSPAQKKEFNESTFMQQAAVTQASPLLQKSLTGIISTDITKKQQGNTVGKLETMIRSGLYTGKDLATIQQVLQYERGKVNIQNQIDKKVQQSWNDQFYNENAPRTVVQTTNVMGRTDDKSMMAAYNRDIETNPEGYVFVGANGKTLTIADIRSAYGAEAVVNFVGGSYTMGKAPGQENIGISGQLQVQKPIIVNGVQAVNTDGSPKWETVKVSVNAIPQGPNQSLNNDALAKEFYEVAQKKRVLGRTDEANTAEQMAITLQHDHLYDEIKDFAKDAANPETTIQTRLFMPDGNTKLTFAKVTKKGRGYQVRFDNNSMYSFEVENEEELLVKMAAMTQPD